LDKKVEKIGLGYAFQIVEEIPVNEYDIKVNKIITERGIIVCSGG
jgi:5-formyltetrahydrofolate cyclo-ligase